MKFHFTGLYNTVTDASTSVIYYAGWQKPVPVDNANYGQISNARYDVSIRAGGAVCRARPDHPCVGGG